MMHWREEHDAFSVGFAQIHWRREKNVISDLHKSLPYLFIDIFFSVSLSKKIGIIFDVYFIHGRNPLFSEFILFLSLIQ